MSFQTIAVTEKDKNLIITILEKRIYLGVTDIFAEEINKALANEFEKVIIDLKEVSVMNSTGIGVLIKTRDELLKRNKQVELINLQPLMMDIFSRMRLDILFEIVAKT